METSCVPGTFPEDQSNLNKQYKCPLVKYVLKLKCLEKKKYREKKALMISGLDKEAEAKDNVSHKNVIEKTNKKRDKFIREFHKGIS